MARVAQLKAEVDADPGASARRRQAAQERAARDIAERAKRARAALDRVKAARDKRAKSHAKDEAQKSEAKVSLSDPQARWMRFADGSIKAGYNIQIAAAGQEKDLILSVMATDRRNDAGLAVPMVDDLKRRYGRVPKRLLADTHYATAEDIAALAARDDGAVLVYAPPPEERDDVKPQTLKRRAAERAKEPPALKDWRCRMETEEGQAIYRGRRRIELINAHLKNRGFDRLNLRGLVKAKITALWHALAHNILVANRLRLAHA
jgi:hypothetical protein